MKIYKTQEGSETWNSSGNVSQFELKYFVLDVTTKQDAMQTVWDDSPGAYEGLPRNSIRFDGFDADKNAEITVVYQRNSSSADSGEENEASSSFDCGGGTKHVVKSIKTRKIKSGSRDTGGFIEWNGKTGTKSEIKGVDVPDAQLRETYTKTMPLSKFTTRYKRKIAAMVGCVNGSSFKGWQKGEVMFLGCSYSANNSSSVSVTFNFSIQLNESGYKIADGVPAASKEGFEYAWAIHTTENINGVPAVKVSDAYIEQVVPYADFSELGI